jgi:hypothetical protein
MKYENNLKTTLYIYKMLKKLCRNCSHIRLSPSELLSNNFRYAKCAKFGQTVNLVSGEIKYPTAERIRNDFNMCGKEGKYYVQSFFDEK